MVWVETEFTQTYNALNHTQMAQCKVEWLNRETNGLSHTQIVQCKVEWLKERQMV